MRVPLGGRQPQNSGADLEQELWPGRLHREGGRSHAGPAASMGRRRAKAQKVVKKKKPVMMTEFKCPFCNHEGAVECKLDYDKETGSLERVRRVSESLDRSTTWILTRARRASSQVPSLRRDVQRDD